MQWARCVSSGGGWGYSMEGIEDLVGEGIRDGGRFGSLHA